MEPEDSAQNVASPSGAVSEPPKSRSAGTSPSPSPSTSSIDQAIDVQPVPENEGFGMEPEIEEPDELIEDGNVESMVQVIEQEGAPLSPPLQSRDLGSPEPPLHIHGDPVRIPSQVGATAVNEGNMNQHSQELEEELVSVRSEVATLRAALSSEPSKQKLADLEAEKRDLLAVVSQLQSDNSMLEDQSDANAEARSKAHDTVRDLEQRLSTQTDSERSTRLQLQQAQSQVTLLQQDRDWHMEELGKTTEAYQQHRSQSHTQLASLQNRLELSQRNESSATTSLNALKTSHSSLETRLMDTMAKNAELSSKLVESQSAFKADMDASKRLSETLKKRDEQAQLRLEAVDQEWKQAREDMQKREDELIKQAEDERQRADQIQRKMDDLSRLVDTRYSAAPEADESSILPDASTTTGLPLTPNRSSNADLTAPTQSFLLSPAASLASRAQRASGAALSANKSYSELYTSYISSQAELTSAQTECRRLSDCLAGVLQDLEDRAPLLAEQRVQVQQLREQQEQSGKDLAQTMDQRDHEARRAESLRLDLEACQTENGLMASQLRDMGRQMRELLRTLASYEDDGMMDREPDFDPEVYESQAVEEVDTQAVISSQLVTYTSVSEMQRQNTTLLRLTREMGARMDEQDRQLRQRLDEDGDASVAEAHQLVSQMRQQLAELKSKVDSSEKERNMLQRALANGGHQLNSSQAASSSQEADRSVAQHYPLVTSDVQASFDAYKAETSSDIRQLKNDLTAAHKAQQTAESKAARRKAELEFAQERIRLVTDNQERSAAESADLNKQIQRLQTNLSKQDDAVHQANEQVLNLRTERDSISHELKNLRAEKQVWTRTESRLTEDHAQVARERTMLQDSLRQLQNEHNSNEKSISQSRRRMEDHLARVDRQLDDSRTRLASEVETNRQLTVKHELAAREAQRKIDQLSNDLARKQQNLAVVQSTQRHLEQRIVDLGNAIAAKDDKLAIYEGRLPGAGPSQNPSLPKAQQIELELAHLRASLRAADLELTAARRQVEEAEAASAASEGKAVETQKSLETLQSKLEIEIAAKEAHTNTLNSDLEARMSELKAAQDEITSLQNQQGVARTDTEKQLAESRSQLSTTEAERDIARQEAQTAQSALSSQLISARNLNSSYLVEQAAHAESRRRLEALREEVSNLKQSRLLAEQAFESTEVSLKMSKDAWESQRAALQRELDDANQRAGDLKTQNSLLHQHLTSATEQTEKMRQSEGAPAAIEGEEEADTSKLTEIIQYLRGQQELLEAQLQLERQEKARVTAQLQHVEQRLEETRAQLTQERLIISNAASTSAQTEEMQAKVQELALLRDSNETLRSESKRATDRARSLGEKVAHLESQLVPLREQINSLGADLETRDGQIKLLEEDNNRWKSRNEQVLVKYDRIDPAELQGLKDRVESLQKERDTIESARSASEEQNNTLQSELDRTREAFGDARGRFRKIQETAKQQRTEISDLKESISKTATEAEEKLQAKSDEWAAERKSLEEAARQTHAAQLAQAQQEAVSAQETAKATSTSSSETDALQQIKVSLEGQVATLSQSLEEERKRSTELEHKVEEQAATATPDPSVLQTEVEKRMAALVQSSSGQDPTEAEKVIAAERARAVEENSKTLQAEFEKTLSEKDIAHQQALKDLQERVEKSQSEASNSTAYSQQVQDMQKSLREAREKVKTLDALQSDFAKLKEHSNATMTEVENLRQRESQLQNDLQQARAALQEKKTADSKGFSQEDLNAKIQEAVAEESNKRDAEIKSAVAKVQSEEKMKYNIHKNSAATLRTQLKATKEQLTAVQGQLQAAQTGGKAASPVASTSTAPSSTAISSAGLSIKGTGGAKPSDLPPMPVSKGKGAASKAPQAAKTAATAATATTPSAGTSPRGRGRGRLLGNAVSFLAEAASGQPGTKRARDEGQDSTSESDSGQKRRALGRGT